MSESSVTFQKATKETTTSQVTKKTPKVKTQQARKSVFDFWGLGSPSQPTTIQRTITQDMQSFRAESGWGGRGRPNVSHRRKSSGATQASAAGPGDVIQMGARLAGFAHQWQSLLGTCRATNTVEEGVGLISNIDLNSPFPALRSAPGTATRIYRRLLLHCCPREP